MINGIEFYTSPESLPIKRFNRHNKYFLIDNEVGETFEDYGQRTQKAIAFLRKDMKAEAIRELDNRRQMVFNAYNGYSPKNYALALMVKSIDGVAFTDKKYLEEEGLDEILALLDAKGYSRAQMENDLSTTRKKYSGFWKAIFPNTLRQTTTQILTYCLRNV